MRRKKPANMVHDNGGNRLTSILQIVRLKGLLHKWQNATMAPDRCNIKDSPRLATQQILAGRLIKSSKACCDSDEDTCPNPGMPPDVPKGYLAVYVGPELRRFIIPTSYLSDPLFKVLLEKAEEEFGFDQFGGLTIPCEIETFKYLLKCMESHQQKGQFDDHQCIA